MMRAMCSQKVVGRKTAEQHMDMLGSKETVYGLAIGYGVRWCRQVLRRDDDRVLRVAIDLK